jgi:hypothetical protein
MDETPGNRLLRCAAGLFVSRAVAAQPRQVLVVLANEQFCEALCGDEPYVVLVRIHHVSDPRARPGGSVRYVLGRLFCLNHHLGRFDELAQQGRAIGGEKATEMHGTRKAIVDRDHGMWLGVSLAQVRDQVPDRRFPKPDALHSGIDAGRNRRSLAHRDAP